MRSFKHPDFLSPILFSIVEGLIKTKKIKCQRLPPIKVYQTSKAPETWACDVASHIGQQNDLDKQTVAREILSRLPWLKPGSRAYCPYYDWTAMSNGIMVFKTLPR